MRKTNFSFTISEAAIFLGKSPVTLRQWERKGLVQFPRMGSDRRLSIRDMGNLALTARDLGRITDERLKLIEASLTILELIE